MHKYAVAFAVAVTLAGCSAQEPTVETRTVFVRPPLHKTTPAPATVTVTPKPVPTTADHRTEIGIDVDYVVDGDTIRLTNGQYVRIIGIDTPEKGEPCHDEATHSLESMIGDEDIQLESVPGEDQDRYGRLLRYVLQDGDDLGLEQIRKGYAIARYDGLDNYHSHPLQDLYHQEDENSPPVC